MNNKGTTLIFDLERGQFWKGNQFGYTDNIEEAGRFSYDDAYQIRKNADFATNTISTLIFDEDDKNTLAKIQPYINNPQQPIKKLSIERICEYISKELMYSETNPYGKIVDIFENNGWYIKDADKLNDVYVGYGENKKIKIEFENSTSGANLILIRLDSGRYETVAYSLPENKKQKIKP